VHLLPLPHLDSFHLHIPSPPPPKSPTLPLFFPSTRPESWGKGEGILTAIPTSRLNLMILKLNKLIPPPPPQSPSPFFNYPLTPDSNKYSHFLCTCFVFHKCFQKCVSSSMVIWSFKNPCLPITNPHSGLFFWYHPVLNNLPQCVQSMFLTSWMSFLLLLYHDQDQ
jgi:hypothetical protein